MWSRTLSFACGVFCLISSLILNMMHVGLCTSASASHCDLHNKVQDLEKLVGTISRQLMMQQFYVEEQTRASGNSGIKRMRNTKTGSRPYYSATHVDGMLAAMHDHSNFPRTIGLGELVAVLNGIEFRTRHNDYILGMKSTTNKDYGAVEDIPFPDVPPEVLKYKKVSEQVAEMKEWFRAWKNQDYSVRDYRKYFKPVVCYLEGMWTHSDQDTIEEPFSSDRHHLDAKSWLDLQEKIRFTSYSGTKDGLENFAYLPTTVFSIDNGTVPVLVQWNFRILCHPMSVDIPLRLIQPVDDLKTRISRGLRFNAYAKSRAARFQLVTDSRGHKMDKAVEYDILDRIMAEIPGTDNYPGEIEENIMGDTVMSYDTKREGPLNVAYYHRVFRVDTPGAMGLKIRSRGFGDENLFLAQTTNPKVAGLPVERCDEKTCHKFFQRWSYAIPLEIIYMTPLVKWNPYHIEYKGSKDEAHGMSIYKGPNGRRDGSNSPDKALNGTNSKDFYRTPYEFFKDAAYFDPADTTQDFTCVLDPHEHVRRVRASGHWIYFPEIPGVGNIRQRYPIMPIHGEGDTVSKELEALKDIVLFPSKYNYMFRESDPQHSSADDCKMVGDHCYNPEGSDEEDAQDDAEDAEEASDGKLHFLLQASSPEFESHTHHFELSAQEARLYARGQTINVVTEESHGHAHMLNIGLLLRNGVDVDIARHCDGEPTCWDGHSRRIKRVTE